MHSVVCGPGVIVGTRGPKPATWVCIATSDWVIDTAYSLVPSADIDLKFVYYLVNYVGLNRLKPAHRIRR